MSNSSLLCARANTECRCWPHRATTVEPRQGLVKALFERETYWMRGAEGQRWLFAALGMAVQIAHRRASRRGPSTWNINEEVIGV
jgi:hypothetical protein